MNEIYSVTSYCNLFVYSFYDFDSKTYGQFIISESTNDIKKILDRLEKIQNQIGFGNLKYDYPILHYIISCRNMFASLDGKSCCERIYSYIRNYQAENVFDSFNKKFMTQLDLESFFGFKSGDRNITLTDIKIALSMIDAQHQSFEWIVPQNKIYLVLQESRSNAMAISSLYNLAIGKTARKNYKGINLVSARHLLCEALSVKGLNDPPTIFAQKYFTALYNEIEKETKQTTAQSDSKSKFISSIINLRECLPSYAIFENSIFNAVVDKMSKTLISKTNPYSQTISFNGILLKFGMGGVHGCANPGKYITTDEDIIVDIDIISMYASIAIGLNIIPKSASATFIETMRSVLDLRMSSLLKKDDVSRGVVVITKQILNYIYGKTKEESFIFYDPSYSVKIVIAAQLFTAKFMELLKKYLSEIKFLMVNTDGMTFIMKKSEKDLLRKVYKMMIDVIPTIKAKIRTYDVLYIKDVNNYIGSSNDEIISKGCFDCNLDIYKDNSFPIIPIAIRDYLFYNIPVRETLEDSPLLDFAGKVKSSDSLIYKYISNGEKVQEPIQNPTRYIYTKDYKKSGTILNKNESSIVKIESYYPITILNALNKGAEQINYQYYESEIQDLIYEISHSEKEKLF